MSENTLNDNRKAPAFELTSAFLHILAMALMLLDHSWATFPGTGIWMTCLGRLAFPIFAFLIAEGFLRTRNVKKYALRLLIFAVISEIPFDLLYEGIVFTPFHQNVLWTFLIALLGMSLMERARKKGKIWNTVCMDTVIVLATYLLGIVALTDYNGPGVLTVYVFYFLRRRNWLNRAGQLVLLWIINSVLIKGHFFLITLGGIPFELHFQTFAVAALIPIWLYRGKQGHHSRAFKYFCYAFYPVHALVLYFVSLI